MPLYLVRWPTLSAALVKAASEAELLSMLDEVGNSEGCTWTIYRGPLYLEFSLPVDMKLNHPEEAKGPIAPDEITLAKIGALRERQMDVAIAGADAGYEMMMEIARRCFPAVHELWDRIEEPSEEKIREAVMTELEVFLRADWRRQNLERSSDPAARLAATMDMSVELARQYLERAKPRGKPGK